MKYPSIFACRLIASLTCSNISSSEFSVLDRRFMPSNVVPMSLKKVFAYNVGSMKMKIMMQMSERQQNMAITCQSAIDAQRTVVFTSNGSLEIKKLNK